MHSYLRIHYSSVLKHQLNGMSSALLYHARKKEEILGDCNTLCEYYFSRNSLTWKRYMDHFTQDK